MTGEQEQVDCHSVVGVETRRPRVLVVDDDAATRMLCTLNLELAGFEALAAADGRCGLERALADAPDLVLLDVRMRPRRSANTSTAAAERR
ncbi:MAG TPA: response regulator [Gaiellaceae bacterium]|nr:response regulator [Gaiellaceae bacterium]